MNSKNFKVSVCITIFNEPQESVNKLLDALISQLLDLRWVSKSVYKIMEK